MFIESKMPLNCSLVKKTHITLFATNISVICASKVSADSNFCAVWLVKLSERYLFFCFSNKKTYSTDYEIPKIQNYKQKSPEE